MQSTMRNATMAFMVLALLALSALPAAAVTLAAGDKAPDFMLEDLDGKKVSLDQFRGKTVVIAFWSTWCSRCEEELLFLRDMFGKRSDVAVLLVNQDSERKISRERILNLKDKIGISFPILLDEGLALWDKFGINALPTSVVIGKNGEIKLVEPNFYWGSPENLLSAIGQS